MAKVFYSTLHNTHTQHTHTHTKTHTQVPNQFTTLWILSGTTQVSQNQKKHSSTHTYHGHQSSLICFLHLLQSMASSVFKFTCLTVFFHNLSSGFLWSTSSPGTLHFTLHTFFTQSLSSFRSAFHYHHKLFCCSTDCHLIIVSLSTRYLELYLVASCHTSI